MKFHPLGISGCWRVEFQKFEDNRGYFYESFKAHEFRKEIGRNFNIKQVSNSSSSKGTLRGIHYAQVPPSQAKFVQCIRGSIKDFVIDIRRGSQTFGQFEEIDLNEGSAGGVFIEEGLGHAFVALENNTFVNYYLSEIYNPNRENSINPFDKTLNIHWPHLNLILSEKDKQAKSLIENECEGVVPSFDECKKFIRGLY
jgi:dTDP-4-dehydrorhamnose 3,5-epimerase